MYKKAKIVNLSLNSNKEQSPTIHLAHSHQQQQLQSAHLKQQALLHDCYQAIKTITTEKEKALNQDKKLVSKTQQVFQARKTQKDYEIKLPLGIIQSVQHILKRYISAKAQEQQSSAPGNIKPKQIQKKKSINNAFFSKKNKENTEHSVEDDYQYLFQDSQGSPFGNKLTNKITECERQLQYYKQKVAEQASTIAKLESREILARKRYCQEINKIVRNKNLQNIHLTFQQLQQGQHRRNLLNITGKNNNICIKDRQQSSDSIKSSHSLDNSFKQQPFLKQTATPIKKKAVNKYKVNGAKKEIKKDKSIEKETTKELKIAWLKEELGTLRRQKDKYLDQFNNLSQKYQKEIDQIDEKIGRKMKQIRQEEQLITDEELKNLKDEDFETLQMNGFYQEAQHPLPSEL